MLRTPTCHFLRSASLCLAVLLAGCGGGSGNNGNNGNNNSNSAGGDTPSLPLADVRTAIDPGNFVAVSANAYVALANTASLPGPLNDVLSGVAVSPAGGPGMARPVLDMFYLASAQAPQATVKGVEQTVACESGSVTMSGTVANPNSLAQGDTLAIAAHACRLNGAVLDGGMTISVSQLSGAPREDRAWSGTLSVGFSRFSIASSAGSQESNGDMTLEIRQSAPSAQTLILTGKSLAMTLRTAGKPDLARTLLNYRIDNAWSGTSMTYSGNYTLSGVSATHGAYLVGVSTDTAFVSEIGGYPRSGAMSISGADSSARLTAEGELVRIAAINGSGTVQSATSFNWAGLSAMY